MIEKVEGPGSVRGAQQTREVRRVVRTGSTGGATFVKHLDPLSESEAAGAASGATSLGTISPVVSLQEVDDAMARKSRGKARAKEILDRLEDIRLELLTGSVSKDRLMQLSRMVAQRRQDIDDPRLTEILDDIDLRAQVELAKLGY
ncbi:MAG: flagellar assembly protein FliX [Alphaproteobacteria bacterium]